MSQSGSKTTLSVAAVFSSLAITTVAADTTPQYDQFGQITSVAGSLPETKFSEAVRHHLIGAIARYPAKSNENLVVATKSGERFDPTYNMIAKPRPTRKTGGDNSRTVVPKQGAPARLQK
jgi:hypothetical protein